MTLISLLLVRKLGHRKLRKVPRDAAGKWWSWNSNLDIVVQGSVLLALLYAVSDDFSLNALNYLTLLRKL